MSKENCLCSFTAVSIFSMYVSMCLCINQSDLKSMWDRNHVVRASLKFCIDPCVSSFEEKLHSECLV